MKSKTGITRIGFICIGILLMNFANSQPDHYGFSKIPITNTFNTNDYQGGIQNWDISQDQRGFVYVANNFGLLEYDGNSWRNYTVTNNTRVRSVFVNSDNRIYIGGQNQFGYFEPDSAGRLEFHSLYALLDKKNRNLEDIWKIIKHDDKILFCSYLGVISYDGHSVKGIPTRDDHDLPFQVAKNLYIHSLVDGLSQWNEESFVPIPGSEVLTNSEVTDIIAFKNNSLLIFQKNGSIYEFKNEQFIQWDVGFQEFLNASLINKALLLANNNIAIGTQNNGLIIISPTGRVLKHLTKGKGLSNRTVLALHEDPFNNLWVGLNNGLSMVELASPFSLIDEQSGLPGTGYCAALHEDRIYLGTSNGLFFQQAQPNPIGTQTEYKMVENSGGQVYNVQNINGELLLSHHDGAFQVYDDRAEQFYDQTGTWKFMNSVGPNKLLAGTYEGFVVLEKGPDGYAPTRHLADFKESSRVFEFQNDSTLIMAHGYKGVFKITLNENYDDITEIDFYGADAGFPSDILINVFSIGNDLVFPAETGIYQYNRSSDRFVPHQEFNRLLGPESHTTALAHDFTGKIFFLTNTEVGYLEPTAYGGYDKHTATFSRMRKYLSDDLENITVLDHQNVLFGAKEGFVHYNPSVTHTQERTFSTYIRRVESVTDTHNVDYDGASPVESLDEISFPAYFSSLKFTYSAPYFDGQDEIVYQYQLENFDKGWSEWSDASEKEYTNLSQGDYTFRVRAKNVYGKISEPAVFPIRVIPPWYRSKLAYAVYGMTLLLLFGISMYLLDARHKIEKKELTLNQKRELQKKESEIEQVSKASEERITKLKNDKLRAEIDHKNRELATTTMHLINKNEFMLSIRDTIKEIAKSGSKDGFKKIVRDIDRNMSEDEGWEHFTRHFDQVHGDFLSNIKRDHPGLTPQEIKLCAYLRMNMSSKEIANLLNISVRGVEISRYRLRKKLNISRETNLVDYMLEYS